MTTNAELQYIFSYYANSAGIIDIDNFNKATNDWKYDVVVIGLGRPLTTAEYMIVSDIYNGNFGFVKGQIPSCNELCAKGIVDCVECKPTPTPIVTPTVPTVTTTPVPTVTTTPVPTTVTTTPVPTCDTTTHFKLPIIGCQKKTNVYIGGIAISIAGLYVISKMS